jgi:hypothetical protein
VPRRTRPSFSIALTTLALAGCYYVEEEEPSADTVRRIWAEGFPAPKRQRNAAWVLVKYSSGNAPHAVGWQAEQVELTPLGGEGTASPIRAAYVPEPEGPHESILIREGESGFLALARSELVRSFTCGGRSLGGDGRPVDRGFEISPRALRDGRVAVALAPVFVAADVGGRSAPERGHELRAGELAFGLPMEEGRGVMLYAAPGARDDVVQALFGFVPPEADSESRASPRTLALWFEVAIVP